MSFQEKTRWVGLAVNLIVWGWYFTQVLALIRAGIGGEEARFAGLGLTIAVIVASTVIWIVAATAIALHRPGEANARLDERERAITRKAGASAYTLLSLGLVIAIGGNYTGWSQFVTVNAVLLAFIVAECARHLLEIVAFRRGVA